MLWKAARDLEEDTEDTKGSHRVGTYFIPHYISTLPGVCTAPYLGDYAKLLQGRVETKFKSIILSFVGTASQKEGGSAHSPEIRDQHLQFFTYENCTLPVIQNGFSLRLPP